MEKSAHRRGRNNPSFSSSLLDAIYRSIDESDCGSPGPALSSSKKQSAAEDKKLIPPPPPPADPRYHFSSSSSSECSSIGGFSSSDAEFTARPRSVLTRCDLILSDPPPERKRTSSIGSRIRDLRNLRGPTSPGARLTAFLNAIFSGGGGTPRKQKFAAVEEESATSSAKSCIKTPTSSRGGKLRSVRFSPANIVAVEDSREKRHLGEDPTAARNQRMIVDELLRGFDMEEEEESDCESVSSSELFELDSLSAIGRFTDELPVYETTDLSAKRAIAHGFIV